MDSRTYAKQSTEMGERYEQGMVPVIFAPWAALLIDRVPPQPGERVLDVACGTGAVARLVVARVGLSGTVVGADLSPSMLAAARRVSEGLPIAWHEADATALPFADASFDLVLCQQGLQYFPDRGAALREMRRVLAPGGRVGLAVWGPLEESPGYAALEQVLAKHLGPEAGVLHPFALGDAGLVRGLVAAAGFRAIEVRHETLSARWPSAGASLDQMMAGTTMLTGLAAMSEGERRALVEEYERAVAAYIGDEGFVAPRTSHLIIARA